MKITRKSSSVAESQNRGESIQNNDSCCAQCKFCWGREGFVGAFSYGYHDSFVLVNFFCFWRNNAEGALPTGSQHAAFYFPAGGKIDDVMAVRFFGFLSHPRNPSPNPNSWL